MPRVISLAIVIIVLTTTYAWAQDSQPTSRPSSQPSSAPAKLPFDKKWIDDLATPVRIGKNGRWAEYGGPVTMKSQTSLKAVANNPAAFENKPLLLRAKILSICPKKGCWMQVQDGGERLFVKFKDYAFFAPRHLSGHDVLLEGKLSHTVVKEGERRHLAEDAGKSKEEIARIKGDKFQLRMLAHAIRILTPQPKPAFVFTLHVGDFNPKNRAYVIEDVIAENSPHWGHLIDVLGQVVSASSTGIIAESSGKRLVMQFSNDTLISKEILKQLQRSSKPVFIQGHGRLLKDRTGITFSLKGAQFTF